LKFAVKFSNITFHSGRVPPEKYQAASLHCLTSHYLKMTCRKSLFGTQRVNQTLADLEEFFPAGPQRQL